MEKDAIDRTSLGGYRCGREDDGCKDAGKLHFECVLVQIAWLDCLQEAGDEVVDAVERGSVLLSLYRHLQAARLSALGRLKNARMMSTHGMITCLVGDYRP